MRSALRLVLLSLSLALAASRASAGDAPGSTTWTGTPPQIADALVARLRSAPRLQVGAICIPGGEEMGFSRPMLDLMLLGRAARARLSGLVDDPEIGSEVVFVLGAVGDASTVDLLVSRLPAARTPSATASLRDVAFSFALTSLTSEPIDRGREGTFPPSRETDALWRAWWARERAGFRVPIRRASDTFMPDYPMLKNATPIYAAAAKGDAATIAALLAQGWEADAGAPLAPAPLCAAVMGGHLAAAKALLDAGAEASRPSPMDRTPLEYAAAAGDAALTSLLLAAGADASSAIDCAAESGSREVCEMLLRAGANVNLTLRGGRPRTGLAFADARAGPLHRAAARGDREVCELLLDHGAAPDAADGHGATPLHFAAFEGRAGAVRLLVARGATVDLPAEVGIAPAPEGGKAWTWLAGTPLQLAVQRGRLEAARALLEAGASATAPGPRGKSAEALAREGGDRKMIELLTRPREAR